MRKPFADVRVASLDRTKEAALARTVSAPLRTRLARLTKDSSEEEFTEIAEHINALSVSEVASLLGRLNKRPRAVAYRLLEKELALAVFEALSPASQSDLLDALQDHDTAEIFLGLDPEDRVWLLDELPATVASKLMQGLDVDEREETAALLGYPEAAVGRRMSPRFIPLFPSLTVEEAMSRIRTNLGSAESIYYLPVVDEGRKVLGEVQLRQLMNSNGDDTIVDLVRPTRTAEATEDAEEVARRMARRGTFAVSIVDHEHRLLGILPLSDAARILEYEESQDVSRQGGVEPIRRPYLATPVLRLVRSRIIWLLVLAIGATLTVQVLEIFEDALAQVTVLALFVPLLIGTGGNTGNQAATTVTRAIALDHLGPRDIFRVLSREMRTGVLLGLTLGALGFAITGFFYDFDVGLVIGLTLLAVCTVAASIGGIMPLIAKLVKVDPAVFSNPFITTFVDATGLVIYFLIAQAVLQIS